MFRWQRLALVATMWCLANLPGFAQSPVPIAVSGGYSPNLPTMPMPAGPAGPPPTLDPNLYSPNGFPIPNAWEQGGANKFAAIFQIKVDFISVELEPAQLPTTLTSGDSTDLVPGALGQPNTLALHGGKQSLGHAFGSRIFMTYWFADPEVLAVDTNFFVTEKLAPSWSFASDATGLPLIARPFFDTSTGAQSRVLIASPNLRDGNASNQMMSRLAGAEANLKVCINGGLYNTDNLSGPSIYVLGGARWLHFEEQFRAQSTSSLSPVGITDNLDDRFHVRNQFLGGQLGFQIRQRWWRITGDLVGKCAVGPNQEFANLSGTTTRIDATGNISMDSTQGLYVQASNAGRYQRVVYTAVPEFFAGLGFDINEHIRFNAGYTLLGVTNLLRPQALINPAVNDQPFLQAPNAPFSPGRPGLQNSSFYAHWVSFGFELVY